VSANLHVVRGKPTAHTFVLQVSMEALGEEFILARIADEAGVELDRLVEQRGKYSIRLSGKPTPRTNAMGSGPEFFKV